MAHSGKSMGVFIQPQVVLPAHGGPRKTTKIPRSLSAHHAFFRSGIWGFSKVRGTISGFPIRIILCWSPPTLGNYRMV